MRLVAILSGLLLGLSVTVSPLLAQSEFFAGEWRTDWGPTKVFRDGSGFRGSYTAEDGNTDNDGAFVLSKNGNTWTGYWAESLANEKCDTERFGTRYWGTLELGTEFSASGFSMHWGYCEDKSPERLWVFNIKTSGTETATSPSVYKPSSVLRTLKSGFWEGAVKSDSQGYASYCYLLGQKSNKGFTIQLSWNSDGFHVLIHSSDWSLFEGEEFSGQVRIDNRFDELIAASVFDSESIDYVFGFNNNAIEAFQSGSSITMEGPAGERTFRLNGTRKAVDVLVNCADEFLVAEGEPESDSAPNYETGFAAYQEGDYLEALENWRPLAEMGQAKAQNGLGGLYYYGRAVPQSHSIAVDWFQLSAEQGYVRAQDNLGAMYRDGSGVKKDFAEAARWYRLAAEQGLAKAQNSLGVRYSNGQGVSRDFTEAVYWFKAAAEQGNASAQNHLGELYRDGEGVVRNNEIAINWFRLSAEQEYDRGQQNLDAMLASGVADLPNEPVQPTETVGLTQTLSSGENSEKPTFADALLDRAFTTLEGDSTPAQAATVRKVVETAVTMSDSRAMLLMSLMLENGIGGPVDLDLSRDYLNQAADALLPEALYRRATLTAESDPEAALLDIRLAAAEGYIPALQVYATLKYWESSEAGETEGTPTTPQIAKGDLIAIQAMLNSLGYQTGPPLGEMTEGTTAAITAFQKKENLPIDGLPSIVLRDRLVEELEGGN